MADLAASPEIPPQGPQSAPEARPSGPGYRVPRSPRTRAAALVALLLLVGSGVLLYDAASSWAGHRPGSWRGWLAGQLDTRQLSTGWVLGGAAVVLLFGGWLLVLAVASGGRRWLVLRHAPGAVIDRKGVAALLQTRALALPMVAHARVRAGRRRHRVTVHGSADLAAAQQELAAELARIGLLTEPTLRVRGRPVKHRPPVH
ncbi:DUF6286 domain-containing protein [Kitasatospora kifunensis]|uniref:DUF6286 domain-containing protein n=1 Tax=Kitasatospora kifunensis TaxID=58351 RepID=A0A7W7VX13_KITKI|nr:DUF6286 domain-containing protein [Kitasatospora kifunensis]MBB4925996.1 hypothetical protein [Kitasatospora kifunensis]